MSLIARILLVLSLGLLTSCAASARRLPPLLPESDVEYHLGPGDVLLITVFGEADFTGPFPVSASGGLDMPLIGTIPAAHLTVTQLQQKLVERLDAKAIKTPNVTISITTYRPFFILGEVKNPGSYPYVPNMTVLAAVAVAGGFTYRAAQSEISVTREQGGVAREARAKRDSRVLPGDVVNIFERHL